MKGLLKAKPRSPAELIRHARDLLIYANRNTEPRESKRREKIWELHKLILETRTTLYGDDQSEPVAETCAQLTHEFFKGDMFRLFITCLPKLDLGARQDVTQVVANLQKQRINSWLIASDYMEQNVDLVDNLVTGYMLESEHMKKFFDYIQSPNVDIASDAAAPFKVEIF
ncbi:putative MO25-like protein At5g47540 isoform X2 [Actinidia eriantha]|uniref:putative MO25-like protein At5g47540 isoform X2 n=1 Tax=Actinidia eriantha TaxID=165200 RepID=UPI00258A773D|nr:putative MO25-like protein At5g47540 isoform X2 [Actinidia eriantha]XP_057508740.1 putative MO25-like protein At5g47540 isoform X2 [Actinidia eriantha]